MDIIEILIALGVIYGLYNKFFNKGEKRKYKQPDRSPAETDWDDSVFNADEEMHKTTDVKMETQAESGDGDHHWTSKSADAGTFSYQSNENDPDEYLENEKSLEHKPKAEYQASLENRRGDIVREAPDTNINRLKEIRKEKKKSRLQKLLKNKKALADGIILSEVLGDPVARKRKNRR